jgi:hypothetical protein
MQAIDDEETNKYPILVRTEELTVELMLWQCVGGLCGEPRDYIRERIERLMSAGNRNDDFEQELPINPHLFQFIDSASKLLAEKIIPSADEDNMRSDFQVVLFVLAGVTVMSLLLLAGLLSVLRLALRLTAKPPGKRKRQIDCIQDFLSGSVALITLLASLLHPALTWTEDTTYRSGYIIMLLCSILIVITSSRWDYEIAFFQRGAAKMSSLFSAMTQKQLFSVGEFERKSVDSKAQSFSFETVL